MFPRCPSGPSPEKVAEVNEVVLAKEGITALKEGDPLPSVRTVAAETRVNPITVLKGYQQLADEGLVETRRGRGMFINEGARELLLEGERRADEPIVLSEFGGIAFIPPGHEVPKEAWGYSGVEKTRELALARLRGLYEAIAKIPAFAGICYTQITDVEQEINGLLTYDRKMKFEAKEIKALNDLLR